MMARTVPSIMSMPLLLLYIFSFIIINNNNIFIVLSDTLNEHIATEDANRCSKSTKCWKCISDDICAWCTNGDADGLCIYKSQRMQLCDGMKDNFITRGYGCPNSVLDGGSAGPKQEKGFGTSNRTENMKKFKERTKKKINTCKELSDLIDRCSSKKSKINSSTKTFMAFIFSGFTWNGT